MSRLPKREPLKFRAQSPVVPRSGNVPLRDPSQLIPLILALTLFSPTRAFAAERPTYFYRVKGQDTISEVLYRFGIKPIYGVKGTLRDTLVLNPDVNKTKGDEIFPGEILYLPLERKEQLAGRGRVLPTGEVVELRQRIAEISTNRANDQRKIENRTLASEGPKPADKTQSESETKGPVPTSSPGEGAPDQTMFVIPQLLYTGISARDKSNGGTLRATDGNYGFRLGYAQKWSEDLTLYAVVSWYKIELKSPLSTGTTTSESSYSGFAIGTRHQLSESLSLGTSFGYQQEPIVSAASLTNLVIDRVGLVEVGLNLSKVLIKSSNRHFSLAGELGSSLTLPTRTQNFNAHLGYAAYGKLAARSNLGPRTNLELGPYYRFQSLNTTLVEQTLTSLGLTVQFQWWFGTP